MEENEDTRTISFIVNSKQRRETVILLIYLNPWDLDEIKKEVFVRTRIVMIRTSKGHYVSHRMKIVMNAHIFFCKSCITDEQNKQMWW